MFNSLPNIELNEVFVLPNYLHVVNEKLFHLGLIHRKDVQKFGELVSSTKNIGKTVMNFCHQLLYWRHWWEPIVAKFGKKFRQCCFSTHASNTPWVNRWVKRPFKISEIIDECFVDIIYLSSCYRCEALLMKS